MSSYLGLKSCAQNIPLETRLVRYYGRYAYCLDILSSSIERIPERLCRTNEYQFLGGFIEKPLRSSCLARNDS